jgi:hypothetical protein
MLELERSVSLCRWDDRSCGACCWGSDVTRIELAPRLKRQKLLFAKFVGRKCRPSWLRLLFHELRSHSLSELLFVPLLVLPGISPWLRGRLRRRLICPFVAFEEEPEQSVGCLLHPTLWCGADRRSAAFRLFVGFGCGPSDFICSGARRFALSTPQTRERFRRLASNLDWYNFSRAAAVFPKIEEPRLYLSVEEE